MKIKINIEPDEFIAFLDSTYEEERDGPGYECNLPGYHYLNI